MHPPAPPQPKESRRHTRYEMLASVELRADAETLILPARNISLGGVYLQADGHDLGGFVVGTEIEVLVFDGLDEQQRPVRLAAEVVRHDGHGLALMWATTDGEAAMQLARLLNSMQPKADSR